MGKADKLAKELDDLAREQDPDTASRDYTQDERAEMGSRWSRLNMEYQLARATQRDEPEERSNSWFGSSGGWGR